MNKISITKEVYDREITKKFVKDTVEKILKELDLDNVEVSILLTDDKRIRELNRDWRGKDKTTDVLSFPAGEDFLGGYKYKLLGDIVISVPFARRQAKEIGYTPKEEILRLLIHGILHLLGYDHETSEEDARVMFSLQDKIFSNISL